MPYFVPNAHTHTPRYEEAVEMATPRTAAEAALAEKLLSNKEKSNAGNEVKVSTFEPFSCSVAL
jgi:hypothetical protein